MRQLKICKLGWAGVLNFFSFVLLLLRAEAEEFAPSAGPQTSSLLTTSTPILHPRDSGLKETALSVEFPSAGPWIPTDDRFSTFSIPAARSSTSEDQDWSEVALPSAGPGPVKARVGKLALLAELAQPPLQSKLSQVAYQGHEEVRRPPEHAVHHHHRKHKHALRQKQRQSRRNTEEFRMEFSTGSIMDSTFELYSDTGNKGPVLPRAASGGDWIFSRLVVTASLFIASFVLVCIGCWASGVYGVSLQGAAKRSNAAAEEEVIVKKPLMAPEPEGDLHPARRKVLLLYASPLFIMNTHTDALSELPRIPIEREWELLHRCLEATRIPGNDGKTCQPAPAYLAAELLTASSLQRALASCQTGRISTAVLHISAHSHRNDLGDCLVAENGKGSAHLVDGAHLQHMLPTSAPDGERSTKGVELVVLHTCNSKALGERIARGGVPHVVCADGDVLDSVSSVFIQALYARLFDGMSVMAAFRFATVAVETSPESHKKPIHSFCLLPEGASHSSVIFSSSLANAADGSHSPWQRHASTSSVLHSPLQSSMPTMPEDFMGRAFDVWSILQHLSGCRRVVVVCGANGTLPGVGKSSVLDAVHRSYELQVGGTVLAVPVRAITDPAMIYNPTTTWLQRIRTVVQAAREAAGNGHRRLSYHSVDHSNDSLSRQAAEMDPARMLQALISDLRSLAAECRTGSSRKWEVGASAATRLLLILDECDHLAQQRHFQDALCAILRNCPECKVLLSSHQRLVGAPLSHFKVIHHELEGLDQLASAKLFLRRAHRLVRMSEVVSNASVEEKEQSISVSNAKHLKLLARHPAVDRLAGNPRRIIATASLVGPSLRSLSSLPMHG